MKKQNKLEIQGILSLGYVYLIVLGVLNETLYYNQIGVDILNYSNILDVLISPISKLTSSILLLTVLVIIIFVAFTLPNFLVKYKDKKWFKKSIKLEPNLSETEIKSSLLNTYIFIFAVGLFGFFIGTGSGNGFKMLNKIEKEEIDYNDYIEFINGDRANVEIVGENSAYIFYLKKENKTVQIAPINGIIKSIEKNK